MCKYIDAAGVVAGFGCCHYRRYNGLQRALCTGCGQARCKPLTPDLETGRSFETYDQAYADNPDMLARVRAQLARG